MSAQSSWKNRPSKVLILAQNPVSHAPHDVLSEACASGRRAAKWLTSSGLADETRYELAFENVYPEPGKVPPLSRLDPSHVYETVAVFEPDLILCFGKVASAFCEVFLAMENKLDWYHPSGLNRQLNAVKDDEWTGVALGCEVAMAIEDFYDDVDSVTTREAGRELVRASLGLTGNGGME